jgi:predicted transposase/invertase (TIGR01784 family)
MTDLLDPTNDYVFKRLFAEAPDLLVALINDLRPDLPNIEAVEILNPNIEPAELTGKYIILDVLAKDGAGHGYNVEVQVRRYDAWHKRGLFYLARLLGTQLNAGEDYAELRASVGLHLLDFDLFTETEAQRRQATWRFEMRDQHQPAVSLGNALQMNLVELGKADRLGVPDGPLRAWITFFKHWQEELTMANVAHEPVKKAMNRIRELSADEEARRLAFVRERALRDEVSFINDAERRGRREGRQEGRQEGRREEAQRILHRLLTKRFGDLPEWASQKLASSDAQQLEEWADEILVAKSLDELFKHSSS